VNHCCATDPPGRLVKRLGSAYLAWALFFFIPPGALGQYVSQSWTTANGLPSNNIRAIRRARNGYLWMTTDAGLVRFDGLSFHVFSSFDTPGLLSDRYSFAALLEDNQGGLWAGTSDAGAVLYRDGIFRTLTTKDGLPSDRVFRIDEGPDGRIWIFTDPGLSYWKNERLVQVAPGPGSLAEGALADPSKYFGRDGPFWGKWRKDTSGWQRFVYGEWSRFPLPPQIINPEDLRIESIFEDSKHRLWYKLWNYPGEYYCLAHGHLEIYKGLPRTSFVAYLDKEDHFWISDHNGHSALWKTGRFSALKNFSTPNLFHSLEEPDGGLWVATIGAGLFHFRPRLIEWIAHPGGPEIGATLLRSRTGTVWIGSLGLAKFGKEPSQVFYPGLPGFSNSNLITALYEDRTGTLWVGTREGVRWFRNGHFEHDSQIDKIEGEISAIVQDRSARLWFGSNQGLYSLSNRRLILYKRADGLAGDLVTALLVDEQNRLWIGTDKGLSYFSGGRIMPWTKPHNWRSGGVTSLYRDNAHVLWAGTYDRGLVRIEGDVPTSFTTKQGLPGNAVYQIVEDNEGFLWLGTRNGLVRLRKDELSEFAVGRLKYIALTRFDDTDGLTHAACVTLGQPGSFKADDGALWFSTVGGIAIVNPKSVPVQSRPPDVLIEEELLDQRSASARNGLLKVIPRQANLEIRYTALSPYKPEQIRFSYQLLGLDRDWVDAGTRRTAYYSHLPPGEYDFRVIAGNSGGVWNRTGRQLHIVVPPPFYLTWWFTSLLSLTMAALAVVLWHYRTRQLKRAHAVQQAFSRQLIASQERERKRIAAELHDSLGQRLVVIKNLATISLNSRNDHGEPDRNVEEIVSEASQGLSEVKEISYNLRPYQLDRMGLTKAIEALARTSATASAIALTATVDNIDDIFPKDTQINFYRMVQEGVNNILKHSGAKQASITVCREPHRILLTVRDDGKGFLPLHSNADLQRGGFGLVGIAERAQLLAGTAVIQSEPGLGTTIRVEIKLKDIPNGG
jgi:signal transduction histidine kinase/ligand-binding sensor domain-containing protein